MALIRRIGFTRFSRWGDNLGRLTVSAATHTDALDGTDELNITCAEDLVKGDRVVWIDLQGVCHEHIVDTIDRVHDDDGASETQAVCINSVNETWDDWLDDKRPSGSVSVALTSILADTRWEVGTCDQSGTASRTFYHESVREGLTGIIETWGGELETLIVHDGAGIVSRRVGVRAKRGNQRSAKRFTWTKDLVSVKRSVASDNPKTRVYGYGKGVETENGGYGRRLAFGDINGGKDYVEDAEATAVWGHPDGEGGILPAVASYVNEQCEDAAQLLQETKDYLEQVKEPKVTYTASVIDLYAFGRSWEGVGVGDDVAIIDKGFSDEGVRLHGRVSQIERDLLTGDATVTFGNLTDTMADMWQSVSSALKSNSQQNALYDAAAGTSVSWLIQLQQALNAQFNAVGTYHVETFEIGEIWSNVPLNPETGLPVRATSDMWAINVNGRGQRLAAGLTSNGQWDWRTFFTGGMVTADVINAGTMRAERVRAGLLTDEVGKNFWDMTTGEFSLSSTATVGGETVGEIAESAKDSAVSEAEKKDAARLEQAKKYADEQAKSVGESADKKAKAYVDALDESLGQKSVFDRLTNGGKNKGIYLSNGELFINGTYIKSGVVDAALVKAGILTDKAGKNFWDMTTGEFSLSARAKLGDTSVEDLFSGLDELDKTMDGIAEDGIITEAEHAAVSKILQTVEKESEDLESEYNSLYNSSYLNAQFKAVLRTQYEAVFSANGTHGKLLLRIQNVLDTTTAEELSDAMQLYEMAYSDYAASIKTYNSAARQASNMIEQKQAQDKVDALDDSLTQRDVFNRLTNNGATQGIYLSGGKVYINATYIETGTISDRLGRNTWNLSTGKLTTNYMTATNIDARGTFECGTASNLLRLVGGAIYGYEDSAKIGKIDFSAHSYNVDNPSIKYRGIQMTSEGSVRISSPQISTAASSNESTTATICNTGTISQPVVTEVHDNGNGTVGWHYGTFTLRTINGLVTSYSTVGTG